MDIALLGTGLMGQAMTRRLAEFDDAVTVYNRTRDKALPLAAVGAKVATDAAEAIAAAQCVILALSDAPAIEQVLFSAGGLELAGRTILQTGTILPAQSLALKEAVEKAGGEYLEAPVFGSRPQAESGQLLLMAGSEPGQFDKWLFLLRRLSTEPRYVGVVGQAAALKLALNQLLASMLAGLSLSLGMVTRRGIDAEKFREVLEHTPLHAPWFDTKLPGILRRDFAEPHFTAQMFLKDLGLIVDEGHELQLQVAAVEAIEGIVRTAIDRGLAHADYSSIYNVIAPG